MTDLKELAEKRSALLWIDPRKIGEKPGLNARDMGSPQTIEHIEEICASILERGFLEARPLQIFSDKEGVWVSAGHCRLRAAKMAISRGAQILSVPCLIEPKTTNDLSRQLDQIADNNGGLELTALEAGAAVKKALSIGWSIQKIAAHVGKSPSWVSQIVEFQSAPAEVHEIVKEGAISATLAARTIRERGNEEGSRDIRQAVQSAKANGKKKATAKHMPERRTAPVKSSGTQANDADITIKAGSLGIIVTFAASGPIGPLPESAWRTICNQILGAME